MKDAKEFARFTFAVKEFDDAHLITDVILLGRDGAVRRVVIEVKGVVVDE